MIKILILMLAFVFVSCERHNTTELEIKEERLTSFILRNYKGSRLIWKLTGENAKISDTTVINQLELEFFDENSQPSSKLKADSGYVVHKTNDLKAVGNIIITSSDSTTLWTDELNWSEERQKIFTDKEVKYAKDKEIYRGRGLESDPGLKHIIIKEKFSGKGDFE